MARSLQVDIVLDADSYRRGLRRAAADTSRFNAAITKQGRSLKTSLLAATGLTVGAAGLVKGFQAVIREATEQEVAQRSLAAQFKATGMSLEAYQGQITKTINKISNLAAIEDDEVTAAFTLAFRATRNVAEGLRLTAIAADVARGRHIALNQAVIALNKAYGGNTGALRRLGITIPNTLKGMQALEFVSQRFAGQAAANVTAQERFSVALKNTEQLIGTALLPTFNELLDAASKWLAKPENQKKVQDASKNTATAVGTVVKVFFGAVDVADKVGDAFDKQADKVKQAAKAFLLLGGSAQKAGEDIRNAALAGAAFRPATNEDIRLRGAGSIRSFPGGAQGPPGRLGFNARFARLELALTKAERTIQERDNRQILVQMAALIRQRLTKVKNAKDLLKLNQQLTGVLQQIQQIDNQQRQKELELRQQAADKAKAHAAKVKAILDRQKQALKDAVTGVIDQMGQLFDVFVPDDPAKGILGVTGGTVNIKSLTARLKAQTDQQVRFNNDLARLAKRGAPPALIASLRQQGLAGASLNVHALATTGTRADFNAFLRQYNRRQRVAQTIAHAEIQAKTVFITTGDIRHRATKVSQRRGPTAGVKP